MPVSITIDAHDFIGGPDAHRPYHLIVGTVSCDAPYTPGGELFGADELETAIQTLLGRNDITVSTVQAMLLGESSDEDALFRMNAAGTRIMAFERPSTSITPNALPTESWSDALVVAGHTTAVPGTGVPLAVAITAGVATGPCKIGHGAPAVTLDCQWDLGARALNFLAADTVTECRVHLLDRGGAASINVDGTPVEYGAVDISAILCKFTAVVT